MVVTKMLVLLVMGLELYSQCGILRIFLSLSESNLFWWIIVVLTLFLHQNWFHVKCERAKILQTFPHCAEHYHEKLVGWMVHMNIPRLYHRLHIICINITHFYYTLYKLLLIIFIYENSDTKWWKWKGEFISQMHVENWKVTCMLLCSLCIYSIRRCM